MVEAAEIGEPREQAEAEVTGNDVFMAVFSFGLEAEEQKPVLLTRDEQALAAGAEWLAQAERGALLGETLQALLDQRSKNGIRTGDIHRLRKLFLEEVGHQTLASIRPQDVL